MPVDCASEPMATAFSLLACVSEPIAIALPLLSAPLAIACAFEPMAKFHPPPLASASEP